MPPEDASQESPKSLVEDQVRAMFRLGKYAEAVPFLHEHLAAHPEDVPAYELMADALRYTGDKGGAAGALATASELYAQRGMTLESIAANKRVMKLGVEPDFSRLRAGVASAPAASRVPTPLFDELSDEEFQEVAQLLDAQSFEPGRTLVVEGEPGDSMFIVVRGQLEVTTRGPQGDVKLAELSSGDFFGEVALLHGRPRTATIKARTPAECLVLRRDDWQALVARFPRVREVMETWNARRAASTIEALVKRRHG
jgi:hypothetical protein